MSKQEELATKHIKLWWDNQDNGIKAVAYSCYIAGYSAKEREDNKQYLELVANYNNLKDEYNNVCKFANSYEEQRDSLSSITLQAYEYLVSWPMYENLPKDHPVKLAVDVLKKTLIGS